VTLTSPQGSSIVCSSESLLVLFGQASGQLVVFESFPSVDLILASGDEKLVLQALKLRWRSFVDQALWGASSRCKERFHIVSFSLVFDKDFFPLDEELVSSVLRHSLLNIATFHVTIDDGAAWNLFVLNCKKICLSLLVDVQGHLDKVVGSVGINAPWLINQALVLDRVGLVEETFTGKTRHLRLCNQALVLQDNLAKLGVGSVLCRLTQRQHLLFEATTKFKELFDESCTLCLR